MFVYICVLHHQKKKMPLTLLPGAIMGAYKDKDKDMEGLMRLSGPSTSEAALKTSRTTTSRTVQHVFVLKDCSLPG